MPPDSVLPSGKDDVLGDLDMVEILSGCMDGQDDVKELAEGLMEMNDELLAMIEDDSFLQFPCKFLQSLTVVYISIVASNKIMILTLSVVSVLGHIN